MILMGLYCFRVSKWVLIGFLGGFSHDRGLVMVDYSYIKKHQRDQVYKGQLISIYRLFTRHNTPMDMFEICVYEGGGPETDADDCKEPIFKSNWDNSSADAIELGKAFIDGMFHERANNQRNTNEL